MFEAILYEKLPGLQVQCNVCQWRCKINPGQRGVCRMRLNRGGRLDVLGHEEVSSVAADPIEKKPLFHFFPGTLVYSLGSWGCNFHCVHCQNWEIACVDGVLGSRKLSAEAAVNNAKKMHCAGIAWTYNEPAMWLEYTIESAKLARKNQLYTVYVTNGYLTPEALDAIGPYLDAWRVDVKGFSESFYQRVAKVRHWQAILEVTKRAMKKWGMHVEVVTNVIPTLNDDDRQLSGIAGWIYHELGPLTPWHVTRFYPHHKLANLPPTPIETLDRAAEIGRDVGLRFVYTGNIAGRDENTVCYHCNKLIIRRVGYNTQVVGTRGSRCDYCGSELNIRTWLGRSGTQVLPGGV